MKELETVIGLEIHVHLLTQSKIFCSCRNSFEEFPNRNICPVCLGLPGVLPVLNREAFRLALRAALALNCRINPLIRFDRKHYFYPDLPKNFQISQYNLPLAEEGFLEIFTQGGYKRISIKRVHMEEDAGKLVHQQDCSLVDYNRTGCPLIEIVTYPVIGSPQEASDFLQQLRILLRYIGVSNCDMEKGSLRCDANISLREKGQSSLGVKTELKNMNSFRAVKLALEYEVLRQSQLLKEGKSVSQETRLWDEKMQKTFGMRSKEEAHDYRYFPEPDLPPFFIKEEDILSAKEKLPLLPLERLKVIVEKTNLSAEETLFLIQDKQTLDFFEECLKYYNQPRSVYNWIRVGLQEYINEKGLSSFGDISLEPKNFTKIVELMDKGSLNNQQAKKLLFLHLDTGKDVEKIIKDEGLVQISDRSFIEEAVNKVIKENPKAVKDYLSGKQNAIMFLVGQVMKHTRGQINPKTAREFLQRRIDNEGEA